MKITKQKLKQIIKEEYAKVMSESSEVDALRKQRDVEVAELKAADPNWPKWEEMSDMELKVGGGYSSLSQERVDKMLQKAGYADEAAFYYAMRRMSEVVDDTLKAIAETYRAYNKKIKALPKPESKPSPSYPRGKEAWDAVVYDGLDYGSDY